MPGWPEAAARIGAARVLAGAIDLQQEQYAALHAGEELPGLAEYRPPDQFVVERIGTSDQPDFQDIGLEYYAYVRTAATG